MDTNHDLLEFFDFDLLIIFLGIIAVPLAMFATLMIINWGYRRSLARSMNQSASNEYLDIPVHSQEPAASAREKLNIKFLDAVDVDDKSPIVMKGIEDASNITYKIQKAYFAAAISFAIIANCALTIAAFANEIPFDAVIIIFYLLLANEIVIVIRVYHYDRKLRTLILVGYLLIGIFLILYLAMHSSAIIFPALLSFFVLPAFGLFLLTSKKLEPILFLLVAILLFVVIITLIFSPLLSSAELSEINALFYILGAVNLILGILIFWWLLQRHSVIGPIIILCALAAIGIAGIKFTESDHDAILIVNSVIFGLPFNVLQIFLMWLIFKLFIWMQNKKILPGEVMRSHLCLGWLTGYFITLSLYGSPFFGNTIWLPWTLVGAFVIYLVVLHVQLVRLSTEHSLKSAKRLLFLRVFGSAEKREKLLDELDNTWRRLGRIDLITGADLVSRSLKSIMLEAFLLRRVDDQFLRTDSEVDLRLKNLHSDIEGDFRFPVNSINCYSSAWRTAVMKLAQDVDVILVDLRGFNRANKGCEFEINHLIQNVSLRRCILLIDYATDVQALNDIALLSWETLPFNSPNAQDSKPELIALNFDSCTKKETNALFSLLLRASITSY